MQDWIQERLAKIDGLYPPERLAKSKERWRRLWAGEEALDRYPVVFYPLALGYYDIGPTDDRIRRYLDEFIWRGRLEDDFIPAFFPGCHQGTIPGMFGAKPLVINGDTSCERLIFEAEDIERLPEPAIRPGMVAYDWLETEQYFMTETGGRLPCNVTDMQGPADVSGQLWGYDNLLAAAYMDPESYRAIMGKATEAFILLWRRQMEVVGEGHFVGTHLWGWNWVPQGNGATASVDSMVMVSPSYFMEHMEPYLARIAEAFGGLTIHSCGDFAHLVPELGKMPYLRGINAGEMSVRAMVDAGLDKRLVIIAGATMDNVEESFGYIRKEGVRVCLSANIWAVPSGKAGQPALWNEDDWKGVRANAERVLELACIV